MNANEIYNVVHKLVGPIAPVGDTTVDDERFQNLQTMAYLAATLLDEIGDVSFSNMDAHQSSRKRARDYADEFMNRLGKELTE